MMYLFCYINDPSWFTYFVETGKAWGMPVAVIIVAIIGIYKVVNFIDIYKWKLNKIQKLYSTFYKLSGHGNFVVRMAENLSLSINWTKFKNDPNMATYLGKIRERFPIMDQDMLKEARKQLSECLGIVEESLYEDLDELIGEYARAGLLNDSMLTGHFEYLKNKEEDLDELTLLKKTIPELSKKTLKKLKEAAIKQTDKSKKGKF